VDGLPSAQWLLDALTLVFEAAPEKFPRLELCRDEERGVARGVPQGVACKLGGVTCAETRATAAAAAARKLRVFRAELLCGKAVLKFRGVAGLLVLVPPKP